MKPCSCKSKKSPHFCAPTADLAADFFPRRLTHVKGRWAGQPFKLLNWQRDDLINPIFGELVWDSELKRWVRRIRTAYTEIGRKNGKSSIGAGIALKLLFADGERGAEVYSVAEDLDQANVVFAVARAMVEANQGLSERARCFKRLIEVPKTGNIYRVLPGDAAGSHGLNVHGLIFDELRTQTSRELWDVMTSAQGAREQPLTLALTTAGTDRHSICWEQHEYGEKIAKRIIEDPSFHYVRYGFDVGDDWQDEALWRRSNPSLGHTVTLSFLRGEFKKAKQSPGRQNTFRNMYLCEWTSSAVRWMDLSRWDRSAGMVDAPKLKGKQCYGGLDASYSQDLAALCWDFDGERLWRFFLPEDRLQDLNERTAGQASGWVSDGWLTLTPGDVTDYSAIKNKIIEDSRQFDVSEIAFNSHSITPLVNELQEEEFEMVAISQGTKSLSPGTKELERLVLDNKYVHGGNPIMRWAIDGLVVRRDSDQDIKPDKEKSSVNITGVVAAVMALDRRLRQEDDTIEPMVYVGGEGAG